MYNWTTLLFNRNYHNLVNSLNFSKAKKNQSRRKWNEDQKSSRRDQWNPELVFWKENLHYVPLAETWVTVTSTGRQWRRFPPRSCSLFPFLPKSSWIYFPWENKKQAFISSQQFTSSSLPGIPSPITSIVLLLPRLQLRWFHLLIATCWSSSITRINSLSSSPNEIHRLLLFLPLSPLSS